MIRLLITCVAFLTSSVVFFCTNTYGNDKGPTKSMKLVYPKSSKLNEPIQVEWKLIDKDLHVDFLVNSPVLHEKKNFSSTDYPFQFDVVEVFIAVDVYEDNNNLTYYEFELTPNGQTYHLRLDVINGKRKGRDTIELEAKTSFQRNEKNWSGHFIIPLDKLGWKGDLKTLRGNFYSIIGKPDNKTYWSLFLGQQKNPNFHTPSSFQNLFPNN